MSEIEEQERALAGSNITTTVGESATSEPSSLQVHSSVAGCGKQINLPNLAKHVIRLGFQIDQPQHL